MTDPQLRPPQPATHLFPESLRLSPKQREVLEALETFPDGAKASELAEHLGIHVNTVRGHLDELVGHRLAHVVTAPSNGRGRPSLLFRVRVPDQRTIAQHYVALIDVLIDALDPACTSDKDRAEIARTIGRRWAMQMNATERGGEPASMHQLIALLRDMGFDPDSGTGSNTLRKSIALQACPFITEEGHLPSPAVCALHQGFLDGTVGDRVKLELQIASPAGQCSVVVEE